MLVLLVVVVVVVGGLGSALLLLLFLLSLLLLLLLLLTTAVGVVVVVVLTGREGVATTTEAGVGGAELQAMASQSMGGLSGASAWERISSWTMSFRPTL